MPRVAAIMVAVAVGAIALVLLRDEPDADDLSPSRAAQRAEDVVQPKRRPSVASRDPVSSPYREGEAKSVELRGRVSGQDGREIPHSAVELRLWRGATSFLDADATEKLVADQSGEFLFRLPDAGPWGAVFTARVDDHICTPTRLTIRPDAPPPSPVIIAYALDGYRDVRVVDAEARPIEGAIIRTRDTGETATTDVNGSARVRVSETYGRFRAEITHPGHATLVGSIEAWPGEGPRHLEFVMTAGSAISGEVSDRTGRPIPGVVVRVVSYVGIRTTTDETGSFNLDGIDPGGDIRLTFRHPDFLPGIEELDEKRRRAPIDVTMQRGVDICGTVEAPDGRRLAGALVTLGAEKFVGRNMRTTDGTGTFCVGAPLSKEVTLRVTYPGLVPFIGKLTARDGAEPLLVRLESGNRISGRVIDESGNGIAGAFIDAHVEESADIDRWARTDNDGHWSIDGIPAVVDLTVDRYGFMSVTRRGVESGRDDLTLTLTRSGSIDGTVVGPNGQPVTRFRVTMFAPRGAVDTAPLRAPSGWPPPGRLFEDPDGRFSSGRTPLIPGRPYQFEIHAPGFATAVIGPYVPTLQPRNEPVRVALEHGGGVHGRALDERGQPVSGAVVAIAGTFAGEKADIDQGLRARSGNDGEWELRGLGIGPVDLEMRHPRFRPAPLFAVVARGESRPLGNTVLSEVGLLEIELRVPSDVPVSRTTVIVKPGDGSQPQRHAMTGPSLRVPWIGVGEHEVSLVSDAPEFDGLSSPVTIHAGRSRRVIFHPVAPQCDLSGIVTIDGAAPNGVVVDLVLSRQAADGSLTRHARQRTRSDGSFSFANLSPGSWHVAASFTTSGRRHSGALEIELAPRHPTVTLALTTR